MAVTDIGTQTTWTIERIARLKYLRDAGLSCAQIANEIGVSRNAVIGKSNRLGLSRFDATIGKPERTVTRRRYRYPRALSANPQFGLAEMEGNGASRCSLFDLQQWHCRWPIGDPGSEDFGFCGTKAVDGLPYCVAHARLAYRPGSRERGHDRR
jgi:GcrA cell cycle regulator